jgi:ABC-type uncharacterized transport system permease subunit
MSKGIFRYVWGTIFLILVAIRLIGKYDLIKSKTLSMDELKEKYPEIYYKLYATDEEKLEYWGTKNNKEIMKLIKNSKKSSLEIYVDENPDITVKIITAIIYVLAGALMILILRSYGLI